MNKKNILVLEKNQKNYSILANILKKATFESTMVIDKKGLVGQEKKFSQYDLIIVNAHITYISPEEISKLFSLADTSDIPLFYMDTTKEGDKERLTECFEFGATEYLKKPFDSKEIIIRVTHHIQMSLKAKEWQLRVEKLAHLATVDQLSKTTSKMHMKAILNHQIKYMRRYKKDAVVVYFTVMNINKIIGILGINKGEKIIALFAKELKSCIRDSDELGRWSGADFVLYLPNTSIDLARNIIKKIKVKLRQKDVYQKVELELAFGLTSFYDEDTADDVLQRATYSLGKAKQQEYGKIAVA